MKLVRVQVLGPVRLWRDDHEIAVRSDRQRATLALLAAAGGGPISRAEMISVLWGERPPRSAVNIIQTYVKHLRRILEPTRVARTPGTMIRAVGDGYAVNAATIDIDLMRFRELAAAASEALRHGDRNIAAELLSQSLAVWSGLPFVDVPLLASHAKATALLNERRTALLRYGEVMIDLGGAGDVVRPLEEAVRDQPLDETTVALFIRACQAAGHRARAFEVYQEMRHRLADELGVDPGPELAAAHAALLERPGSAAASGPSPAMPEAAAAHRREPGQVVPAQLPPANPAFVGRAGEVQRLEEFLSARGPEATRTTTVVIHGPAGIGKTTLALHWAHRLTGRYLDGQLYVDLRGFGPTGNAMTAAEAARRFLDAFGVPPARIPASVESQLGLYRSLLAGRRVLVVLDNAGDAEQARPLLPGAPGCIAIVTSRRRLSSLVAAEGARPLTLDLLPADDARQLLAQHVGGDRVTAEPAAVDQIVQRCGRLPLALAVTAARAATQPVFTLAAIATELDQARYVLDAFADTDAAADVRATFSWSYQALHAEAAALFRLFGLYPGTDITVLAAAALAGLPARRVRSLITELTSAHLATEHAPGRYHLHDLLLGYARELVEAQDSATHRLAAIERLLDHYVHTGHAAAVLINPQLDPIAISLQSATIEPGPLRDGRQAWAWFDAERANALSAVNLAMEAGFHRHAWQLAWALRSALQRGGYWHELQASQMVALDAADRLGNQAARVTSHRSLAAVLSQLGQFDDATDHLTRALDLATALNDPMGQARTHATLNRLYSSQGQDAEALSHALTALDLFRSVQHVAGQADALTSAAWNLAVLGRHEDALDHGRRAMQLLVRSGDRLGQAGVWDTIGYVQHHLGDHTDAMDSYRRAINLMRHMGELHGEAVSWLHLGDTYQAVGDDGLARDAWRRALDILDRLGHADAQQAHIRLAAIAT